MSIPCKYEREIGIMTTEIDNIKQTSKRIEDKLDSFIDAADKKYATNERLSLVEQALVAQINERKDDIEQNRDTSKNNNKEILNIRLKYAELAGLAAILIKLLIG